MYMSALQHQKHFWFEFVWCMENGPSIGWTKGVACAFEKHWNKRRSKIPYFAWPTRVLASPHETTRRIAVATSLLTQKYCILIGSEPVDPTKLPVQCTSMVLPVVFRVLVLCICTHVPSIQQYHTSCVVCKSTPSTSTMNWEQRTTGSTRYWSIEPVECINTWLCRQCFLCCCLIKHCRGYFSGGGMVIKSSCDGNTRAWTTPVLGGTSSLHPIKFNVLKKSMLSSSTYKYIRWKTLIES